MSEISYLEEDEIFAEYPNLTAAEKSPGLVDDIITNLQLERQQVDTTIISRSSSKRKHTNLTRQVKQAIDNHGKGIRLSKVELNKVKITLIECHDTAVKKHNAFVDTVPKHFGRSTRYLSNLASSI